MGRAIIIIIAGAMTFYMVTNLSLNSNINESLESTVDFYSDVQARNIANSVVYMELAKLGDSTDYRVTNTASKVLFGGSATYSVKDTTISGTDYIAIRATGNYYNSTQLVEVMVFPSSAGFIPASVLAAITTNNPIQTLGTLEVDGRDHDLNGNLTGTAGTLGIWTTSTYTRSGNSKVGGTTGGSDYAPVKAYNAGLVTTSGLWPGGYPNDPDSVLGGTAQGFPPGTLKSVAQAGTGGSQYTTNPATLTYPLRGVTYVELSSGSTWNAANITGEGILIVHNTSTNAIIKNLNTGPFKGVVIADDIVHIHTTIIGAVIGLTSAPSSGNCIGNGTGDVLYSKEAIEKATGNALGGGTPDDFGYAKTRMTVSDWYE